MLLGLLLGLVSGIVAGMGMGGGTLLIPLITTILNIEQKTAQGINLISFIPMAIVSIIIHIKNKLVNFKVGVPIVMSGIIVSLISSILVNKLNNSILRKVFGIFLLLIGIYQLICVAHMIINKNKPPNEKSATFKIHIWHN